MNDTASFQQLVRRRLELGAPCCLNPDEIAAVQTLFEERDRLEREKIALAQDVLNGRDRRSAQSEGAESFKAELLAATNSIFHPHIEGTHAVWTRRQAEGGD